MQHSHQNSINRRRLLKVAASFAVAGTTLLLDAFQIAYAAQDHWAWCNQCQGLWFTNNGTNGRCHGTTFGLGGHSSSGSGDYFLAFTPSGITTPQSGPISGTILQPKWKWCNKCQGLFFGGNASQGACPAGGTHDSTGSGDYYLLDNPDGYGISYSGHQQLWFWCQNCQGLWFGGNTTGGSCPSGNAPLGQHVFSGSGNYALPLGAAPSYGA